MVCAPSFFVAQTAVSLKCPLQYQDGASGSYDPTGLSHPVVRSRARRARTVPLGEMSRMPLGEMSRTVKTCVVGEAGENVGKEHRQDLVEVEVGSCGGAVAVLVVRWIAK